MPERLSGKYRDSKAGRLPESDEREARPPVEGEDFYREGPYIVFTERYHLRRGTCCGSGCRHCPWKEKREGLQERD
ncbi:MAG TPA: DUF5522 domain-containing protein [Acidobacteriaceae bacterium]|nr:DUF5522 domain-containing protein [Acidobacteriaceae bacterium]